MRYKEFKGLTIFRGTFIKNVITLVAGTTAAQALSIIAAPLLTRLYSPDDFGIVALYSAILGILSVVANWRYESAIVLPDNDKDALVLLHISLIIAVLMSAVVLLFVAFFREVAATILRVPEMEGWLWALPLSLLSVGIFQPLNYWCIRRKQFSRLSLRTVTQSSVTVVTQVGAGTSIHPGVGGLIGGAILGQIVAAGTLAWQIFRDEGSFITAKMSGSDLKRILRRYKRFPLFDSWSILLNTGSTMMPALLLGYFFQPAVVGYYSLGHRVLTMPMNIVGGAVAQVFFPRATEANRNGELADQTLKMFRKLLEIGLVPILLITLVAPDLFVIVFGTQWLIAGEYIRWIALWLLFVFISSPLSVLYLILEKQREGLVVNVVMFSSRLVALIIGGFSGDALFAIKLFGSTGAILWLFNCTYIIHMAGASIKKAYLAALLQFFYGLPYAILLIGTGYVTSDSLFFVLSAIILGFVHLLVMFYRIKSSGEWL